MKHVVCSTSSSSSVVALLFLVLAAFAETLEAVDGGGQEEAGHDGRHRHRDAGEDDDEVVSEGEVAAALPETVLRQQRERNSPAVQRQRAVQLLQAWNRDHSRLKRSRYYRLITAEVDNHCVCTNFH